VTGQASDSNLWRRILAAAVLIPAALAAVYVGGWALAAWTAAAGLAMSREWVAIVHRESFGWRFALHALALGASQAVLAMGYADWALTSVLFAGLIGSVAAQAREERAVWVVLGIVYVAVPCLAFVWLRQQVPHGLETAVWLLCVVWATDSAAYVAGTTLGGPRLAPQISPNKTWAGAVAGLAAGTLAGVLLVQVAGGVPAAVTVGIGLVLSFLTQCGDLAESVLKRTFGVKDASDLIPGHGGALDRLDGLLFATLGLAAFVSATGRSPLDWVLP
jgi:phosphatidate cytidylyltransferase